MKLDMKKFLDLKAARFRIWGLKTSLGQVGPKAFVKTHIKLQVQNHNSNFHKQDLIFSRIIKSIH